VTVLTDPFPEGFPNTSPAYVKSIILEVPLTVIINFVAEIMPIFGALLLQFLLQIASVVFEF
jgi:hypothetical protein